MTLTTRPQLNRLLVALCALGCLVSGLAIGLLDSWNNLWCGSFVRSSLLLGAFWLGMPTQGRAAAWAGFSPSWVLAGIAAVVLLGRVIRQPQILLPLIGAAMTLLWLWPLLAGKRR